MYSDDFDSTPHIEAPRSSFKNCLMALISALVIVGMLGSAIAGVVWLTRSQSEAQAVMETLNPIIPTLAADPRLGAADTSGEETAVTAPTVESESTSLPDDRINRIVYVSADNHIATINPNGTDGRLLTEISRDYLFPAWSPAGNDIAVIANSASSAAVIQLRDGLEARETNLYFSRRQPVIYLYWSPDGRHLSFITNHPEGGLGLNIATPGESEESRLLALGQPFYWQWTADADQLFIHTGFSGRGARLTLIDVEGDGEGENVAEPGFFQSPGISADGRYWAYAEEVSADSRWVVVADTQSGELQREQHGGQVALSWSPTTNQLAFISGDEGDFRFFGPLRLLDAVTGEMTLLSQDVVIAFFWSPDGRYVAYFTANQVREDEIQVNARQRLGKPGQQRGIEFRLFVVDVMTGEGLQLAAFRPTLTFLTQFLPYFDQYALSHRLWSPDSSALVLPIQVQDEARIFVVPVSGGQPQEIAVGDMAFWSQK
jgi:TolB protein